MELDLLEAKKYLSQQGYGSGTNYTTNLVAVLLANYAQEKVKKLQQHSVMQAEGSGVPKSRNKPKPPCAEGAAVGNSAAGKGVCGGVKNCDGNGIDNGLGYCIYCEEKITRV